MAKAKGKGLAKLAKTKGTKAMKKPPKAAASLMKMMQSKDDGDADDMPQSLGQAFGP